MRVKLDRELQADKDEAARILERKSPITEARQLLLGESQEDARIMRHVGRSSTFMQMEEMTNNVIELENLEKSYGKVFTRDQIRELAIMYRLRFLNSNKFIGKMDRMVTAKIKEFSLETNVGLNEHDLNTRFFVLAEPKAFALNSVKVEHFQGLKDLNNMIKSVKLDPVLFYKIDEQHYRMIHKWGKDFTILRKIIGWKWRSHTHVRWFNFLTQLPVFGLLFGLLFPEFVLLHPIKVSLNIIVLSGLLAWIRNTWYLQSGGHMSENKTVYHNDYFTPSNWNREVKLK